MKNLSKRLTSRTKTLRIAIRAKNLGPDVEYTNSTNCALARSIRQQLNIPVGIRVGVDYHRVDIGGSTWHYIGPSYCFPLFLTDQAKAMVASDPEQIIRIIQLKKHL